MQLSEPELLEELLLEDELLELEELLEEELLEELELLDEVEPPAQLSSNFQEESLPGTDLVHHLAM